MNAVHAAIIAHLRASMADRQGKLARDFIEMSDEQVMKIMFANLRGRGERARGLRLTSYGLDIMGECFRYVEVKFSEDRRHSLADLLYLERATKLPYFCSPQRLVFFESILGMKMRLYDGDIARLRAVEEG